MDKFIVGEVRLCRLSILVVILYLAGLDTFFGAQIFWRLLVYFAVVDENCLNVWKH